MTSSVLWDEAIGSESCCREYKTYFRKQTPNRKHRSTRKWTLRILPQSSSDTKQRKFCALMCVINFVNSRPVEEILTTVEAQIRAYIREHRRGDLFQCPLIALSNSLSPSLPHVRLLPPLSCHPVSADPAAQSRRELSLWWRWQPNSSREIDMAKTDLILPQRLGFFQIPSLCSSVLFSRGRNPRSLAYKSFSKFRAEH